MKFRALVTLIGAATVLAACATDPVSWRKAGATDEQWAADTAACRAQARKLAEDEYARHSNYLDNGGVDNSAGFSNLMRRHDAKRNTVELFERCLRLKGYKKAEPAAKKAS